MNKHSWSSEGFKEGLLDEGIPLGGATIGAGLSALRGGGKNPIMSGITGAALGYAGGSLASLARSRLHGEKKELTHSQKLLGLSGLGYGIGALTHTGAGALAGKLAKGTGSVGRMAKPVANVLHGHDTISGRVAEEIFPATGAVLGAGIAEGTSHKPKSPTGGKVVTSSISLDSFVDELEKIASVKVAELGSTVARAAKTFSLNPMGQQLLKSPAKLKPATAIRGTRVG